RAPCRRKLSRPALVDTGRAARTTMTSEDEHAREPTPPQVETAYGTASAFRPAKREPLLVRTVPVAEEVPRYRFGSARRDLLAGVTVTALALPSAMAYGELAGLSPVNGLYALLGPTLAYVLLGSSRRLVIGPEGSVSTLVAAAVLPLAAAGSEDAVELASFLALLVAACFLLARVLRLGWVADYFSRPVLIGYLHGVAAVGPVPGGLPRPSLPTPPLADVVQLLPAAVGVFLVSFADEILTARAFAGRRGENVRASQALFVLGAAY